MILADTSAVSVSINSEGLSCSFAESFRKPLHDTGRNYLNPCFILSIVCCVQELLGVAILYQTWKLLYKNYYGSFRIKYSFGSSWKIRSVGFSHFLRFTGAALQVVLYTFLITLNGSTPNPRSLSLLISILVSLFVTQLSFLETTRSPVGHGSLILYWLVSVISWTTIVISDFSSPYKIYIPKNENNIVALGLTVETAILVNSCYCFVMEAYMYKPSVELKEYYDLHGWDLSSVQNLLSVLTFRWIQPTLQKIENEVSVDISEIPEAVVELKSDTTTIKLRETWKKALEKVREQKSEKSSSLSKDQRPKPSLFLTLVRIHYKTLLLAFCGDVMDIACVTVAPFLLQSFIIFINESIDPETESPPIIKGFAFAAGIFLCSLVKFISYNQCLSMFFKCSSSIRSSIICLTYEKALKLSPEARSQKSSGEIISHVSVDANEIAASIKNCSDAVTIPLRLATCLFALYKLLGNAVWAGLVTAIILIPMSTFFTTKTIALFNKQMVYRDERNRLTSEMVSAVKSIKLYSWETPMLKKLDDIRNKKELVTMKDTGIYNAGTAFLWNCITFAISIAVYSVYASWMKGQMTPSVVFPALSLFGLLSAPISEFPTIINSLIRAKVAFKRISGFYSLDEVENIVSRTHKTLSPGDVSVAIKNANFVWSTNGSQEESNYALREIDFAAKKATLTCIVGKVGAGKTTMLRALLGDVPMISDNSSISVNGTVAYCSQNPFILNTSVRENIIFGKRYDEYFYRRTVEACQLMSDFKIFPHKDATMVGENGISLSGGQKARVALARAVYARADVYLLDDVLSAVDAHVGNKIIKHVFAGMLATKTVVLATNSMKILPLAHKIVFLNGGRIIEQGSYADLMSEEGEVANLIRDFSKEENADVSDGSVTEISVDEPESSILSETTDGHFLADAKDTNALCRVPSNGSIGQSSVASFGHEYVFEEEHHTTKKLLERKEAKEKGHVKWGVYLEFLRACDWRFIVIWLLFYWGVVVSEVFGNYVLKFWSEKNMASGHNTNTALYLAMYALTGTTGGFLTFLSAYIVWTFSAIKGSRIFHDKMARSVLSSPMSFFETTPAGRILNRFSGDVNIMDQQVIWYLMVFASLLMECFVRLAIVIINLPFMLVVIVGLAVLYNYFRNRYMPASRELKRLSAISRSPIFSHLKESINGLETIRAYGEDERFMHSNRTKVDALTKVMWAIQGTNRWLAVRLQFIAAMIVFTSSMLILYGVYSGRTLSPSMVGFLMTYVFSSTSTLNAIIVSWADVESKAVSLERIIEYGNLPSEAAAVVAGNRPDRHWPDSGAIHFDNYSTRYREDLEPILHGVTFNVRPSEKIGIVGRTGAGKSSLTLALFRIIEPMTGQIDVDGINTSAIGLFDLRSQLNIIPQDAHAFEGTVRENLDPFQQYSDEELWKVLEMAHLKSHVESMQSEGTDANSQSHTGLQAMVLEGGSNLSSGQKQLLCLARALLKESKVLVLDEATAAVDVRTDKIIQETIRAEFSDKTILTIAHRLDTIMDSDRVLVLDRGTIKEFDSPANLLSDTKSEFYSLCKEAGCVEEAGIEK